MNTDFITAITKDDSILIDAIVKRAITAGGSYDPLSLSMDISCAHHAKPLRLAELLVADSMDFFHDILGILQNVDRKTGKFENCFLPRFARRQ